MPKVSKLPKMTKIIFAPAMSRTLNQIRIYG